MVLYIKEKSFQCRRGRPSVHSIPLFRRKKEGFAKRKKRKKKRLVIRDGLEKKVCVIEGKNAQSGEGKRGEKRSGQEGGENLCAIADMWGEGERNFLFSSENLHWGEPHFQRQKEKKSRQEEGGGLDYGA